MYPSENSSPTTTFDVSVDGDLVFIRVRGSLSLPDFANIACINAQVKREQGVFFALYDATRMTGIDPEARKALKSSPQITESMPAATAVFGASYTVQTLGNMIDRAMMALGRRTAGRRFFSTEALARAHLQKERLRLKGL